MALSKLVRGLIVIGLAVAAFFYGGRFVYAAFLSTPQAGERQNVEIAAGMGINQIADLLASKNVIASAAGYQVYGWLDSEARHPQAGTYGLRPGMNYRQISRLLGAGPGRTESELLIIEGWSVDDEADYLQNHNAVKPREFYDIAGSSQNRAPFDNKLREAYPFLKNLPADRSLEGYLFPDTYRVWDDLLPQTLIDKQLTEFQTRFGASVVTSASSPLKTLDEVVTLASIVEKEVSNDDDRKMVAGIFLRRLREGMALQSDATLNYVTHSGRTQANAEDLNLESAYNSYKNRGLPPSPICNPSAAAIQAVLQPTASKYRYFLADKQGKVWYAATLEEHVRNRQRAGY